MTRKTDAPPSTPPLQALPAGFTRFRERVQQRMAQDPMAYGRFTRAYVASTFDECLGEVPARSARCLAPDEDWVGVRRQWLQDCLAAHPEESRDQRLSASRHVADGFRVHAALDRLPDGASTTRVLDALLEMTRPTA